MTDCNMKRARFLIGTPISKRPKEVGKRTTFGHRELDTIVSGRGKEFAYVTDSQLADAICLFINRPLKCLGWLSAQEALMEEVLHLT